MIHLHFGAPVVVSGTDAHASYLGGAAFSGAHLASFTLLGRAAAFEFDAEGDAAVPQLISCSHEAFASPDPPPSPLPPPYPQRWPEAA